MTSNNKDERFTYWEVMKAINNEDYEYLFRYFEATGFDPNSNDIDPFASIYYNLEKMREIYDIWKISKEEI